MRVLGHHALQNLALGLVAELATAELELCQGEKAVMAVQVLVLCVGGYVVQQLIIAAERNTAVQGPERSAAAADVGQVDVHGIAVHGFERVDIDRTVACIDVYENLSRIPDAGHRFKGVPASYEREIGNGIELIEVRAGNAEKIAHHLVRMPGHLQLG